MLIQIATHQPRRLPAIVHHTPVWVWGLLAALLWLGVLFVLSVYYFPTGVVGRLRSLRAAR